jgi:NADH-quinone oxidoreductase subunit J
VTIAEIVFYLLAIMSVAAAIGVVTVPNVVHSALFLVLALLGVAGFYILLANEFLALVQILVYAGAIAILVLFGLMLTRGRDLPEVPASAQWPVALLSAAGLVTLLLIAIVASDWPRDAGQVVVVGIQDIGQVLFRKWLLPFEIASAVLLVALLGAVVISQQEEGEA